MSAPSVAAPQSSWEDLFRKKLALFGHRNWIVIADAAYPAQCAPGVTTIFAEGEPFDVIRRVLSAVADAKHIKARLFADLELAFVSEEDAPGIRVYREGITELVRWPDVQTTAHEQLIGKLDEAAKKFEVLILKTALTIPYTSLFLELDCGYWNAGAEARLRATMGE